eukprot:TRINITY_DN246_c2_g1_i1.p1 TRINITY_DN246_c2_g1~~TRINITY_DN246_c2_g1_i1.p1  ORF type:complete len:724 (+),score=75.46 TRINITY_DN246_c2_g1_i1:69-2174(+)
MKQAKPIEKVLAEGLLLEKTTVKDLAEYIKSKLNTEQERAKAAYEWVLTNIKPNPLNAPGEKTTAAEIEKTLKNGKATSHGFGVLFTALLKEMGIEAATVSGIAKISSGYYDPEKSPEGIAHEWNVFKLDKQWYIADLACGITLEDPSTIDWFYFCPSPTKFVRTHFPNDPYWQLLDPPVTRENFAKFPRYSSLFFTSGFTGTIPETALIETTNPHLALKVLLELKTTPKLQAVLEKLPGKAEVPQAVFVQKLQDYYEINVQIPEEGKYNLLLYTPKSSTDKKLIEIVTYRIKAKNITTEAIVYPEQYIKFTELGGFLYSPLNGKLELDNAVNFKLKVENVEEVDVVVGENWFPLEKAADTSIYQAKVEIEDNEVGVFAKRYGVETFEALLSYKAVAKSVEEQKETSFKPVKKDINVLKECGIDKYPKNEVLTAKKNRLLVEIEAYSDCDIAAALTNEEGEEIEDSSFIQNTGNRFLLDTCFPNNGKYTLSIYAKRGETAGGLPLALEYSVLVTESEKVEHKFPEVFADFKELNSYLYEPLSRTLKGGSSVPFRIKVVKAEAVSVFLGPFEIPLDKTQDQTFYSVNPLQLPKSGSVTVCAMPEEAPMKVLLRYQIMQLIKPSLIINNQQAIMTNQQLLKEQIINGRNCGRVKDEHQQKPGRWDSLIVVGQKRQLWKIKRSQREKTRQNPFAQVKARCQVLL